MKITAKLKALLSHRIALGVLLAFLVTQVNATQHFHADLIHIENCSECLLGNDDPAVTTARLSLPKTEFLSDCCATSPTLGIVAFVTFDKLSRAPPLS